ncbi:MAG: hypothetical protein ACREOS_01970, partial [Candidatus Dormibacteraceae bacterium]
IQTAVYSVTWTMIRYRIPIDAVLISFGAYAALKIWVRIRQEADGLGVGPSPFVGGPDHGIVETE